MNILTMKMNPPKCTLRISSFKMQQYLLPQHKYSILWLYVGLGEYSILFRKLKAINIFIKCSSAQPFPTQQRRRRALATGVKRYMGALRPLSGTCIPGMDSPKLVNCLLSSNFANESVQCLIAGIGKRTQDQGDRGEISSSPSHRLRHCFKVP